MKYTIKHDGYEIAELEIADTETARAAIKEMVQFWGGWETALAKEGGDYTRCWLRMLARFILASGRAPSEEEGWYDLDGTHGIKLLQLWPWEFDPELTEIC